MPKASRPNLMGETAVPDFREDGLLNALRHQRWSHEELGEVLDHILFLLNALRHLR
jgi:hypothetical protein